MTLEFEQAVKALDEHIEIIKNSSLQWLRNTELKALLNLSQSK
jgi:hypothetical protein